MKADTKTKVCYSETNAAGELKKYITSETAWNKLVAKATESKEEPPAVVSQGTFGYSFAESVEEAVTLAGGSVTTAGVYENPGVFLDVFNYAASLRQDNEANDILQGENFEAWEGIKDVSYAVAQKTERAKMTPQERAIRDLAKGGINVTPEQLMAALQLIKQQAGEAAAA